MDIEVVSLNDSRIIGDLRQPKLARQLIVLCHGDQDSRANPTIVAIAGMLNQKGYATFTFNFSPGKGSIDIEQQVGDILHIAEHFKAYSSVILLGASFSALSTAIATTHSARIKGLITISGFFGTNELGGTHRRNFLKFRIASLILPKYRAFYRYFKQELRPELITVPVLVIHSKADKYVHLAQSKRFYVQLTTSKQFVMLEAATHGITSTKDRRQVVEAIDQWLLKEQPGRQ